MRVVLNEVLVLWLDVQLVLVTAEVTFEVLVDTDWLVLTEYAVRIAVLCEVTRLVCADEMVLRMDVQLVAVARLSEASVANEVLNVVL